MKSLLFQFKKLMVLTLFLSVTSLFAQTPDNQYQFDGEVKWMMLTESGTLVASTGEALVGIKPGQSEPHFKLDRLKRVKEEHLETVPNTPYLIIKPRGMFPHTTVVDVVKGEIVFDSKAAGWKGGVTSRYYIFPDKFVVNGMHKGEGMGNYTQGVGLYSLEDGKLIKIFERKASNAMAGMPDVDGDMIIIPGLKNVKAYNYKTGAEIWTGDVKNATSISSNFDTNELYAFRARNGKTQVYKLDIKTGNPLWADGTKLKGNLAQFRFTKGGLAVVTDVDNSGKSKLMKLASGKSQSKIYLLDPNTGADLWDKSPKTKGYVDHFYVEDKGILFGVASGGMNYISFDGKPLWKKPLKTGENIQLMARVPKGVIYISSSQADIIDTNTGESVFGKPIKYKRSKSVVSNFDKDRDRFLLSCKDGLYAINGNDGSYELINDDLNFEGKESANNLEIRNDAILVSSDQNMNWLSFDGSEKKHVYHRAPGKSAFGVILMAATTVAAMSQGMKHAAASGYMKGAGVPSYSTAVKQQDAAADMYANIANASFQEMMKRFKATKATENASFILTKTDNGVGLIKVDKDSGETLKEITVNDKKPMYEVDDYAGVLYFKSKGNTISAYDLNK